MQINILFLSAGRRVELINEFRAEMRDLDVAGEIIAADCNPGLSAACQIADRALVSPVAASDSFEDWLVETCQRFDVALVVPTADHDLIPLAQVSGQLEQMKVGSVVSSLEFVSLCRDKRMTSKIYDDYGLDYPRIMDKSDLQFPLFCKPFDGSSSIGVEVLLSKTDLRDSHLSPLDGCC